MEANEYLPNKIKSHVLTKGIVKPNFKIKTLQKNRKTVSCLETVLNELENKNLLNFEDINILNDIGSANKTLFLRQLNKCDDNTVTQKYSPELRAFALNLNFLSPKAYEYIRKTFNSTLPDTRSLSTWYKCSDCEPGFTTEAFQSIATSVESATTNGDKIILNLVFDEIAIREQQHWDGTKLIGCVDIGDGGNNDALANQMLVFMAVCVNRSWKIPLGYFPIQALNSIQKKNMFILCIENILATGAQLVGITFDGTSTNINTMALLGYDIENIESPPIIKFREHNFLVIPDPVDMMKLIRNTFADLKMFKNETNEVISWQYIDSLIDMQDKEELHVGNKLRRSDIYFQTRKMRVKLGVQLLSKSVADALDFCRNVLKLKDFDGSEPTANFIRRMSNTFDVLNSRKYGRSFGLSESISTENYFEIMNFVKSTINYISQLKTNEGVHLIEHRRKTGFLCMITALKAIEPLYERFIVPCILKFVPFYKLNKDHIEQFFGSIKMQLGFNYDPTVRQFQSIYKKLLVKCHLRDGGIGNYMPLEDINILQFISTNASDTLNKTTPRNNMIDGSEYNEVNNESYFEYFSDILNVQVPQQSEYYMKLVKYISGFVVKKLNIKLHCEECLTALDGKYNTRFMVPYKQNKGFLLIPSNDTVAVCNAVESILRIYPILVENSSELCIHKYFQKIAIETQKSLLYKNLFENQNKHMFENNHYCLLIKAIIETYLNTRCYFISNKKSK